MSLNGISHLRGAGNLAAVPDLVDAGFLLVLGQGGDVGPQVVDGVSDDVRKARCQCSNDDVREGGLLLRQRRILATFGVDGINLWQVLFDPVAQGRDLRVSIADRLERFDLIADLESLVTIQPLQSASLLFVQVVQQSLVGVRLVGVVTDLNNSCQAVIGSA